MLFRSADCLVIVTDVKAVFLDWGTPTQRAVGKVTPRALASHAFAAGSMGPKVAAACEFVRSMGERAVIGSLDQIEAMLARTAGRQVCRDGADSLWRALVKARTETRRWLPDRRCRAPASHRWGHAGV